MKGSDEMKITLKAARVNAGLTIREVAEVISKNKNTIVSWELGKTKISQQDFEQLCELYNIDQKFVKQS